MMATKRLALITGACLLLGLVVVGPAHAQKKSDPNKLIDRFIEKAGADSLYIGNNYAHQELELTENIKNGIVSEIKRELYQVEKRNGDLYKKLIEKNDITVTDSEFQKKDEIVSVGPKLLTRFQFKPERVEILEEEECWVFSFKPKSNLPEDSSKDKVLNKFTGEIWIAKETLNLKKLVTRLSSEVTYSIPGLGSGKLQKGDCVVTAGSIDGHFAINYVEAEYIFSTKLFYFVPFIGGHTIKKIYYQNYERRSR